MKAKHITMVAFAFSAATLATIAIEHYTRPPKLSDADRLKLKLLCKANPSSPLCGLLSLER
jgi:hypothetical protein